MRIQVLDLSFRVHRLILYPNALYLLQFYSFAILIIVVTVAILFIDRLINNHINAYNLTLRLSHYDLIWFQRFSSWIHTIARCLYFAQFLSHLLQGYYEYLLLVA